MSAAHDPGLTPFPELELDAVPAVTAEQMREVDRLMVEELGIDLPRMMENAGASLATLAIRVFGPRSACVLAGRGGNGGRCPPSSSFRFVSQPASSIARRNTSGMSYSSRLIEHFFVLCHLPINNGDFDYPTFCSNRSGLHSKSFKEARWVFFYGLPRKRARRIITPKPTEFGE